MDAKLNIPDISLLLAKQCNISAAKAEAFSKLFFDIIIEGLDNHYFGCFFIIILTMGRIL